MHVGKNNSPIDFGALNKMLAFLCLFFFIVFVSKTQIWSFFINNNHEVEILHSGHVPEQKLDGSSKADSSEAQSSLIISYFVCWKYGSD